MITKLLKVLTILSLITSCSDSKKSSNKTPPLNEVDQIINLESISVGSVVSATADDLITNIVNSNHELSFGSFAPSKGTTKVIELRNTSSSDKSLSFSSLVSPFQLFFNRCPAVLKAKQIRQAHQDNHKI